jgi:excisionase family DNA binding protein
MERKGSIELEQAYKPSAIAKALSVSPNTIYRLIAEKQIQVIRIGSRTLRVPHSELVRMRGQRSGG